MLAVVAACQPAADPPTFAEDLTTLEGQTRAFARNAGIAEFLAQQCADQGIALRDGDGTQMTRAFFERQVAAGNNPEAIAAAVATVDQAALRADTEAYIAARGLRPDDGSAPCGRARAEIADGTGVGRLLTAT
jgi:hypothetical protein